MLLAALQLPSFVAAHLEWFVAALVVIVGLAVVGLGDLRRFVVDGGYHRAWAISGVSFRESIRRRILWMTPLAILGIVVAVQLLNPIDDQDAIRQTIKYALFTTGVVVVLATVILACTNLPREIENRVIFTIVTKPTTRLEIVVGKILGFARVSAMILLIMGLFTWGYAHIRSARLLAHAKARLDTIAPSDPARPSLEHSVKNGLLESKRYARPVAYEQFAREPTPSDKVRWITGDSEQSIVIPFDLPDDLLPKNAPPESNGGLRVDAKIQVESTDTKHKAAVEEVHPTPFPGELPDPEKYPNFQISQSRTAKPVLEVEVLGPDHYSLVSPADLSNGGHVLLSAKEPVPVRDLTTIPARQLDKLYKVPPEPAKRIYIRLAGSPKFRYGVGRGDVRLYSPKLQRYIDSPKGDDGQFVWPEFHGRDFMGNQQLKAGSPGAELSVGTFEFRGVTVPATGTVPFELRIVIEGTGDDNSAKEAPTLVMVDALNLRSGAKTEQLRFPIESNRTTYFNLPASALAGGDFDLHLRSIAPGRYLVFHTTGLTPSLQTVTAEEPFAWNLFKSLLIIWLLSLLVVIVAVFCSTFLSWPIAVVLTVVILMAHWGATQISDTNQPGLGAAMARDLKINDPAASKVFGSTVEGLSTFLNVTSKVMPDISQFSATEDIERSVTIAPRVLLDSLKVIVAFGLPLTVLAYVFLKRKEVAP